MHGRAELEAIIELIFKKAVTEPHYSCLKCGGVEEGWRKGGEEDAEMV